MRLPGFIATGLIAMLGIGVPFWYLMVNYYPQYADNYLYLGVGVLVIILVFSMIAKFAVRRG